MGARFGPENVHSGPHLPRNSHDEDFGPAPGICNGCGDRIGVMDFGLIRAGKVVGIWRLCDPCYRWGNPRNPRDGDPLAA